MTVIDNRMVDEAKFYVTNLLDDKLSYDYRYHNIKHTLDVFNNAEIIGKKSNLSENDLNILKMSALFHDVGYINSAKDHEHYSVVYATKFLESHDVDRLVILQVKNSILATKYPQKPNDAISKILCDADLIYLTFQSGYFTVAESLRQELIKTKGLAISRREFHKNSLKFFNSHKYHSEYGKNILKSLKAKTEILIRNELEKLDS